MPTHICTLRSIYIRVYIYAYMYTYIYMPVHTCVHTHAHRYKSDVLLSRQNFTISYKNSPFVVKVDPQSLFHSVASEIPQLLSYNE